jgi:hypothetical protein
MTPHSKDHGKKHPVAEPSQSKGDLPQVGQVQRSSASRSSHALPVRDRRAERQKKLALVCSLVLVSVGGLLYLYLNDEDGKQTRGGFIEKETGNSGAGTASPASVSAPVPLRRAPAATPTSRLAQPGELPVAVEGQAPGAIPAAVEPAKPTGGLQGTSVRETPRDSGAPTVVAMARNATPPPAALRGHTAASDAGAPAGHAGPGLPGQGPNDMSNPRRDGIGRHPRSSEGYARVSRFLEVGGVDLMGRVINVDTGRPIDGISVEARLEGRLVEVETDASGAFRMSGMVPGSKVLIWINDSRNRMVAERFDMKIPTNGKHVDLGTVRLLEGNELDSRLDGWIGVFLARKEDKVRISAVNAWVPATTAGVEVGDALLSVNGRDTKGLGPRSVAFLLRGPSGSSLTIELESHDGKRRQLTFKRVLR